MKNIKVKVREVTKEDLIETKQIMLRKAKAFYRAQPFATKLWVAQKTGLMLPFIVKHWDEITSD